MGSAIWRLIAAVLLCSIVVESSAATRAQRRAARLAARRAAETSATLAASTETSVTTSASTEATTATKSRRTSRRRAPRFTTGETGSTTSSRDFSFIHLSDTHVDSYTTIPADLSNARSYAGIRTLAALGPIPMRPFGVTAPRPSLAILTGDVTEFGFGGVTNKVVDIYFNGLGLPVRMAPGNHDDTWVADTNRFRRMYGGRCHSLDAFGCHFIALDSASLQDPNPGFAEEVLQYLKDDLKKVKPQTPVFIYCHHPPEGTEFSCPYDFERVLDTVRPWNIVLFLVGHGHNHRRHNFEGIDGVQGWSTFYKTGPPLKNAGYGVCYIRGNELFYAWRPFTEDSATTAAIHKMIPPRSDYPEIRITAPDDAQSFTGGAINVSASVSGTTSTLTNAVWIVDDETSGALQVSGTNLRGSIDSSKLANGAHYLRVSFSSDKRHFQRDTSFYVDAATSGAATARWRTRLGAASKSTPVVLSSTLCLGANDGKMRGIDMKSGKQLWSFDAKAEILASPAVWQGKSLIFGAGDGKVYSISTSGGRKQWEYDAGAAVYSKAAISDDGTVYFGNNHAEIHALDAKTGKPKWKNVDAQFSVEAPVVLAADKLFYGAWDGNLYALDPQTGLQAWKQPGPRCQSGMNRYYAPADAPPVVADGKLFAADRGYAFGSYDTATGKFGGLMPQGAAAVSLGADGQSLLVRGNQEGAKTATPVSRIHLDGSPIWNSDINAGRIPVPPLEANGKVYICTNRGELNAIDAATGKTLWKYRITPKLWVMAGLAVDGDTVYAVGNDGVLTAVEPVKK